MLLLLLLLFISINEFNGWQLENQCVKMLMDVECSICTHILFLVFHLFSVLLFQVYAGFVIHIIIILFKYEELYTLNKLKAKKKKHWNYHRKNIFLLFCLLHLKNPLHRNESKKIRKRKSVECMRILKITLSHFLVSLQLTRSLQCFNRHFTVLQSTFKCVYNIFCSEHWTQSIHDNN